MPDRLLARLLPALLLGALLLMIAPAAEAGDAKGTLYVAAYIDLETAQATPGTRAALVFVYTEKGAKVSSGSGSGGWQTGGQIPLAPGEYWVAVGTEESAANLRRYTVEADRTTVVETGWVSVATLPPEEQPHVGCTTWFAQLRAFAFEPDRGKGDALIDNVSTKPQAYGALQLHPGSYLVEFHGFSGLVEVKAGQDYRLPTGYFGPTLSTEAYLMARKDDDPRTQGLAVCADEAMHVLAGDFFVREMVRLDDGAKLEWVTDPVQIATEGNHGYSPLQRETPPGKPRTADSDDGRAITATERTALTDWGKKQSDYDDLEMFGEPL